MCKRFLMAFSVILILMFCGCSLPGNEKVNLGMEAIERQEYEEALSLFEAALLQDENAELAYRGKGIAYMGLSKYEDSINSFKSALKSSNGLVKKVDIDINYYMALAEYKNGDIDKALDIYNAILEYDDKAFEAYYLKGCIELGELNKEEALMDFDKAVDIKNSDPELFISIYEALMGAGYEEEGKAYISRAVENGGKLSKYQSGLFAYYLGNYDEARILLEEAKDKNKDPELVMYLGKAYVALGDVNYAITLYSDYLNENSESAVLYNELGLLYIRQKEYEKAYEIFEKGLELEDNSCIQSMMFNRAVACEYMLDFKQASQLMSEYIEKYPGDEKAQREYIFLKTR